MSSMSPPLRAHERLALLVALALVAATGWLVLAGLGSGMQPGTTVSVAGGMPGMRMPQPMRASTSGYGPVLVMWLAMMAAMMAPVAGTGALAYLALARRRLGRHATAMTVAFACGYLVAWFGYATLAALTQWLLERAALFSPMGAIDSRYLSSAILIIIGAYQLTPLKRTCVARCRNPLPQLMNDWRDGAPGALRLGLGYARWCVGCCWALMALMLVVGVMNLAWMAALATFIVAEKRVPARWHVDAATGLLAVSWGVWLLARAA